jgi:hypothetical protein
LVVIIAAAYGYLNRIRRSPRVTLLRDRKVQFQVRQLAKMVRLTVGQCRG